MESNDDRPISFCVCGSSSPNTPKKYLDAAYQLAKLISNAGYICVNGGGKHGVMGAVNQSCRDSGGKTIGVVHEQFLAGSEHHSSVTNYLFCRGNDLNERKQLLFDNSDCIVIAPGGVGTFDEMWDAVCGKSLHMKGLNHKPICLLNIDGFFDGSIRQIQQAHQDKLLYDDPEIYFHVANTPDEVFEWCVAAVKALPEIMKTDNKLPESKFVTRHDGAVSTGSWLNLNESQSPGLAIAVSFVVGFAVGIGSYSAVKKYFKRN